MITYYGFTISPNQIETGEGFLICRNVPLARTGDQEYLGSELGLSGEDANRIITVHRPEAEVFSERALASFEGKPVTNDHPPDLIGPDDVKVYEMGHAQNVRRGTGEWSDFMIGDLHIHDASLIDAIQNGKKQISCGYGCDYTENEDGTYTQLNIIGNHIAVVDLARAGKRAAILDSINLIKAEKPERKVANMKHAFLKLFGLAAQDKTPEEIEKLAGDAAEMLESEKVEEEKTEEETKDEAPALDEAVIDSIVEKVMAKVAEKRAEEEAKASDPIDDAIEKLEGGEAEVEPEGDGESRVIPAEEMDEDAQCVDSAIAVSILKAMRPVIAGIRDSAERKAVADAIIKSVTTSDGDMAKLLNTARDNAVSKANNNKSVDFDEIQKMYRQNNPHTRKAE